MCSSRNVHSSSRPGRVIENSKGGGSSKTKFVEGKKSTKARREGRGGRERSYTKNPSKGRAWIFPEHI